MKKQIIMILSAITVCAVFLGCAKATTSSEKIITQTQKQQQHSNKHNQNNIQQNKHLLYI